MDGSVGERTGDRWWIPLVLTLAYSVVFPVVYLALAALDTVPLAVTSAVGAGGILLGIPLFVAGLVGLAKDREYVRATSEWTPSPLYFLMFVLPLGGYLVIVFYLYRRHRFVGTP